MKSPFPIPYSLLTLLTFIGSMPLAHAQTITTGRQSCQLLVAGDKEACQREANEKCSAQKLPSLKDQALCTQDVAKRYDGCLTEEYKQACLESQTAFREVCLPVRDVDFSNPQKTEAWAKSIGQYPRARETVLQFWKKWRECKVDLPECQPVGAWPSVCGEAGRMSDERLSSLKSGAEKEMRELQSLIEKWKGERRWGDALSEVERMEARLKQLEGLDAQSDALTLDGAWFTEAKAFVPRARAEFEQKQRAEMASVRCPKGRGSDPALLKTFQPIWEDYYAGRESERVVDYSEKVEVLRIDGKRAQRREPGERELIEEVPVVACTRQQRKDGQRCYVVAGTMSRVKPDGGSWQDCDIGGLEYDAQMLCEHLKK